jgi:hypothetical protein
MSRSEYGRPLDELPELVAVALGPPHVPAALHHQPLLLRAGVEPPAVEDAAVDDHVVALAVRQLAELRLEHAGALGDVDHLVGLGVPVEVLVLAVGRRVQHGDVGVEQHRRAVERRAAAAVHPRRAPVPVAERVVVGLLPHHVVELADALDRGGRVHVVQERRGAREALVPHELLGVDAAVGLAHRGVPLARHAA